MGDSPFVFQVAGGSLLALCIGFTLALMRQGRTQYKDEKNARQEAEKRVAGALIAHRHEFDVQMAAATAGHSATVEQLLRRIERTEARERQCNRRVDLLITACQRNGVEIPSEVWNLGTG